MSSQTVDAGLMAAASSRVGNTNILRIFLLCIVWYIVSSSNNVVGKTLLTDFSYPVTVTMVQLLSITVYSGPVFSLWGLRRFSDVSWRYYLRIIVPLAFGKFISSLSSHISIWKVPVSYAHTVKATMPLFTVILSRVILGEKQTLPVYISLIPIICGVMIASVTELSFNVTGLVCALLSTMGFSLQNIFSKKVLRETSIHHLNLLHILAKLALFMFLPFWIIYDFRKIIVDDGFIKSDKIIEILFLLFVDGLLNFLQNVIAFSILNLVTPLTYSVANATKRISVITVSLILLKNPVTLANIIGMTMAIVGVFIYNKAKYDAHQAKMKESILPTTMTNKTDSHENALFHQTNLQNGHFKLVPHLQVM